MKTSHLTSLTARVNPFSAASKVPRLVLALLPPNAHKKMQVTSQQLSRNSNLPALLELGFKDGKKMKWEWSETAEEKAAGVADVVQEVNRHTRILSRKEELYG